MSAAIFSLVVVLAVAMPIKENWQQKPKDNFPLSYYPMFSFKRGETYSFHYLVGYDSNNQRYYIPYKMLGNGGFNQVRRQINRKCKEGKTDELLEKAAKRIVKSKEAPFADLQRVEVMKGTFHLDNYFLTENKAPKKEKLLGSKKIERP